MTLDKLRARCAEVAGQAAHVRINAAKVADYTRLILDKYKIITGHDEHHLVTGDYEQTVSYVLALGSINFGSGYFRGVGLEYRNIAGGLKNAFLCGEMDTAEKWAVATAEDLRRIFAPAVPSELTDELMVLFVKHLNYTGRVIVEWHEGKTGNLIGAAAGSAARLVEIVGAWGTFHDVARYRERAVPFLKRAQLLASHLELAGVRFRDMDALTCFADNMIPHVLRCDGVLEYSPALAAKIDAGQPLEAGSVEEIELRALSIHTVELMRAAAPPGTTAPNIDHLLWNRGYEPEIYARHAHRTLTVWY